MEVPAEPVQERSTPPQARRCGWSATTAPRIRPTVLTLSARPTRRCVVTGESTGSASGADYATVAYDAATGTVEWLSRYDGPAHALDVADALANDASGDTMYVTGRSEGSLGAAGATVAYTVATGGCGSRLASTVPEA
jgi:hypothetical protein